MTFPGTWIILRYHTVSWGETPWTKHIEGLNCPPDIFADHIATLKQLGDFISVREGLRRLLVGRFERPTFSIWFDGGFREIWSLARPILDRAGASATVSVSSGFWQHRELWWLSQLSYLRSIDALAPLREKWEPLGCRPGLPAARFVIDHYTPELLSDIHALYMRLAPEAARKDALRLYADRDLLLTMRAHGWLLANHTASGTPATSPAGVATLTEQFAACEKHFAKDLGEPSAFWAPPFDGPGFGCTTAGEDRREVFLPRAEDLADKIQESGGNQALALMQDSPNTAQNGATGLLWRAAPPFVKGRPFVRFLRRILAQVKPPAKGER